MKFLKIATLSLLIVGYANHTGLRAQTRKIDSLKAIVKVEKIDSVRWLQYMRLSVAYVPYNFDSSFVYCQKAMVIAEASESAYLKYHSYNEMGNVYSDKGQNADAIKYYEKSYNVAKVNKTLNHTKPLGNIASIIMSKNQYEEAKTIIKNIIVDELKAPSIDSQNLYIQYQNLGVCNYFTNNLNEAEIAYRKSMAINGKKDLFTYAQSINNIAAVYRAQNKFAEAIKLLNDNASLSSKINSNTIESQRLVSLGISYFRLNNYTEAEKYFLKSNDLKDGVDLNDRQDVSLYLSRIYEKQQRYDLALKSYKKFHAITETLNKQAYDEKIIAFESRIKISEQEKEIASKETELKNTKEQNKKWQIALLVFALLGTIAGLWYYFRQKLVAQKLKTMMIQQKLEAEKAKEMEELKTAFFTNLSHEFRTPITLIKGPLQELTASGKADQKPFLKLISKQVDRLYDLINQLLDLTKVDTGNMPVLKERLEGTSFFTNLASDFDTLAAQKEIIFEKEVHDQLGNLILDSDKIKKIISNILSNAFKFTPIGGHILYQVDKKEDELVITIADTGQGIEPSMVDKVFDRFISVHNKSNYEGTGIGLALSKELALLLKGNITLDSKIGEGSKFTIRLPYEAALSAQDANSDSTLQADPILNKPTLLIIEDNNDMQMYLHELLNQKWTIHQASNGKDGVVKAQEIIPDIIISDVMMPEEDGISALNRIKRSTLTSHIPVIMLTAKADYDAKIHGLQAGAVDYLTKPFDNNELSLKLANILKIRKEQQTVTNQIIYSEITPPKLTEKSEDDKFIESLKVQIDQHYNDEQFSIEALGQKMGMSRSQLYRKVHALTGETPIEILRNYRLTIAKDLLSQKAGNVSEIAFRTGFSSPSYFIKCFKDKYGVTPSSV